MYFFLKKRIQNTDIYLAILNSSQGFCDVRDENVKIIKPIKDISNEELNYYVKIRQLAPVYHSNIKNNSLQSVIYSFVSDLQENFQATISTVCKTADKIGDHNNEFKTDERCIICEVYLNFITIFFYFLIHLLCSIMYKMALKTYYGIFMS